MPYAVLLQSPGGPERLVWQQAPISHLKPGEARVRQTAIGVNFIDIYHRTGLYPLPFYPHGLGMEAAGVVEETGEGVSEFTPGDRVAYTLRMPGAYAEECMVEARRLVRIPGEVSDAQAAAVMMKGLTARYLLRQSFPVKRGDHVLIHAASGGVGLLLTQWAAQLGATVIGTVSTEKKEALARQHGAAHVILYTQEKVSARVREITGGQGVDVVYDSVGQPTFMDSLDALKPLGLMVSFGQSGGKVAPLDIGVLAQKGSLFLTRPMLWDYMQDAETYRQAAEEVLGMVAARKLAVHIDRTLPLSQAADAHRLLESRQTTGAVVLVAG